MEINKMIVKVINLADFRKKSTNKRITEENSESKYISKYEESLKRMTKEDILAIEKLLED